MEHFKNFDFSFKKHNSEYNKKLRFLNKVLSKIDCLSFEVSYLNIGAIIILLPEK